MIIVTDQSEQSSAPHIVEGLRRIFPKLKVINMPHYPYGNTSLTAGDINIIMDNGETIAIERKTVGDLLQSISNRHIQSQIEIMHSKAKYVALVITGKMRYSPDSDKVIDDRFQTDWDGKDVRSLIRKIQLTPAIVEFCPEIEYANMVSEIYQTILKNDNLPKTYKNRIVMFPPVDEKIQFLAQLPGVGLDSANSISNFAGMMEDVQPDEDGNTFGDLIDTFHHMSVMLHYKPKARAGLWGKEKVFTIRKFMGLESDEYIAPVKELEDGSIEIYGKRYYKNGEK